jgi:hypothetical protein
VLNSIGLIRKVGTDESSQPVQRSLAELNPPNTDQIVSVISLDDTFQGTRLRTRVIRQSREEMCEPGCIAGAGAHMEHARIFAECITRNDAGPFFVDAFLAEN